MKTFVTTHPTDAYLPAQSLTCEDEHDLEVTVVGDDQGRAEQQQHDSGRNDDEAPGKEDAHAPGLGSENNRPDDTLADEKKCPECGEPVDDVRATCINCGYEYKDEDHEDPDAGAEFVTGSQIDDEGNELPDEEPPAEGDEAPEEESSG